MHKGRLMCHQKHVIPNWYFFDRASDASEGLQIR